MGKRPAERATPVTRLVQRDPNTMALPAPSKRKLKVNSFVRTAVPVKKPRDEPRTKRISELATATNHKFRIYKDKPAPKTPVSDLKNTSWKQSDDDITAPTSTKITRANFDQEFRVRGPASINPFDFKPPTEPQSELLRDVQTSMTKLVQWYKIHQFDILSKERINHAYTITNVSPFNEVLTLAELENDAGEPREVLLLNYKQGVSSFNRFQKLKRGDRVGLIEGFQVLDGIMMYHNWKLQA